MDKNQQLWNKAKEIIPGGTCLYSKRPARFLPDGWPTYYKKAKGCYIWDLEGNKYLDMSYMGIGACILGYADDDVDSAVKKAIDKGSMSTLNCPEDVELASILISLHPWATKVRFARTGGEAVAIAVRIARAYTGKDKIAYCGYHGWHDWYLAGGTIESKGIPKALKGTAIPFKYNNIESLEKIARENDLAAIVLEPVREHEPKDYFLEGVKSISVEFGIPLIFDEITSGFRETIGGIHLKYGVNPDMCVLGKAMGNGYPISAVIGIDIMDACQDSFISSTFWTERIGPTAALATIKKFSWCEVNNWITFLGNVVKVEYNRIGIRTFNPSPLVGFDLGSLENQTKFNQEMLKEGILASNHIYFSYAHEFKHIAEYLKHAKKIIKNLNKIKLKYPVISPGFKRIT